MEIRFYAENGKIPESMIKEPFRNAVLPRFAIMADSHIGRRYN